uniref:Prolactin receptor 2 n=1 Tax=Oreochromis mossambicus TaxID=8127 RepID=B7T508_OREMO|nr:prolactin receptor 2 [Oreochromis mossambicus]
MVCARMVKHLRLPLLLLLLALAAECNSMSKPGKPGKLGCRSPDKETFFCWWTPGSDGGLPTVHRLYYKTEGRETVRQCPDYHTAHSCFFSKTYTSIWVEYTVIVEASNALGNTSSDPLTFDLMDIVKPYAPENVTLVVSIGDNPHLTIQWHTPSNIDTKSGWVTLKNQLRIKLEKGKIWKNYTSDTQTHFTIYNIELGVVYMVEVRCAIDNSAWSEWTNTTFVKVPNFPRTDNSFWILVFSLSMIPLLAAMIILILKRKTVKKNILPPVPAPKIRGVDVQLLKSGRSEDVINAMLLNQRFPVMMPWKDQNEDYLIVSDKETSYLPLEKNKIFILPVAITLDSEVQSKETSEVDRFLKGSESSSEESSEKTKSSQLLTKCPSKNVLNDEKANQLKGVTEKIIQPFGISGYVDIPRHEHTQEADYSRVNEVNGDNILIMKKENVPHTLDTQGQEGGVLDDYSRVKEVNSDNTVFLEKHSDSVNASIRAKGYIDWVNQKAKSPHVTGHSEMGVCPQLVGCGYVDTFPPPAVI